MSLYQLDIARVLQIYVVQGLIGVFFLFLAYRILKRDIKRLNIIFSLFYIFAAAGVIMNFIYPLITVESTVLTLYYITIFCFLFSPIFLLVLELILIKSEKVIDTKKQLFIIGIYGVLLICMIIIPNGVTINANTDWKPVWSVPYFLYTTIILTFGAIVPGLYYATIIYKNFEDPKLKKKWQYFILGLCGSYILVYGTLIANTLNINVVRLIWTMISLILVIFPPYFLYYGVGKQIEK